MTNVALPVLFDDAARNFPQNIAIVEPGFGGITYARLDALVERVQDRLAVLGVERGDRVGVYMRKSIDTVAAILGILRAGGAYVPVDPAAPPARCGYILQNCRVKALFAEARLEGTLKEHLGRSDQQPFLIPIEGIGGGKGLERSLDSLEAEEPSTHQQTSSAEPEDLAYILYTSGSTGLPKGVMLSHENATSFLGWCTDTITPTPSDRFSSHAPLHFDLSILDIFLPLKHGASVVLIGEDLGKDPARLAEAISEYGITCWYSAPSILSLLAQYGGLEQRDYSGVRLILFAGEVFPIKHLKNLTALLPHPRYMNLYGPTETNVCTFHEVLVPIPPEVTTPVPIGRICSHLEGRVVREDGSDVNVGEEGELCIAGPGVMQGYWGMPEQTQRAFLSDGTKRWYKTGDIVVESAHGQLTYVGRRDRMVKRRGYRIELGEIEAALYRHSTITEAAVVAKQDDEAGVKISAFLSSTTEKKASIIELKRHCAENLPPYMIPDRFLWCEALPKTSTDKIDYQRLKEMV